MASLISERNGRWRLEFDRPAPYSGRGRIRLGEMPKGEAERIQGRVEAILQDLHLGRSHERSLCDWIKEAPRWLRGKLAREHLAEPAAQAVTLGAFLAEYFGALSVKEGTRVAYGHTRDNLTAYFTKDRLLASVGASDADKFRAELVAQGLAAATVSRRIIIARQMFKRAVKWGRITENPFAETKAGLQRNPKRLRFIERETIEAVLKCCPSLDWKLIVCLARYGGLRIPSELAQLRWCDVYWEEKRIIVHSPKTEHHAGHDMRAVPLFVELEPLLLQAFTRSEPGQYVIQDARLRDPRANLRSVMHDIISKAGIEPWPKTFQNLRSTRQTELEEVAPSHVVCGIMGNSEKVAQGHYLQRRESDLGKVLAGLSEAAQKAAQKAAATQAKQTQQVETRKADSAENNGNCGGSRASAGPCGDLLAASVGAVGFEPTKA